MLYLEPGDRPAGPEPERRVHRPCRRPARRRRRPLSARHRPGRETDRRRIFLPWPRSSTSTRPARASARPPSTSTSSTSGPDEILLRADLMDKQIVDIDGRKVVRVNDLRLDEIEGPLRLVAVDVGAAGLLRRPAWRAATDARPQPEAADPGALSTGRTSTRSRRRSPRSSCASRTAWPSSIRPTWPRSSTSSRRATGPACSPRSTTRPWPTPSRRWSPRPRSRSSRTSSRPGRPTSSRRCRPTMPPTSWPTSRTSPRGDPEP